MPICLCVCAHVVWQIDWELESEEDFTIVIKGLRPARKYYLVNARTAQGKLSPERKIVCMYIRYLMRVCAIYHKYMILYSHTR